VRSLAKQAIWEPSLPGRHSAAVTPWPQFAGRHSLAVVRWPSLGGVHLAASIAGIHLLTILNSAARLRPSVRQKTTTAKQRNIFSRLLLT
jgi:hypothetical protein